MKIRLYRGRRRRKWMGRVPTKETGQVVQRQVQSVLHHSPVQMRLKVGTPNDAFEKEADDMASKVMAMPGKEERPQRKCTACEEEQAREEQTVQRQVEEEDKKPENPAAAPAREEDQPPVGKEEEEILQAKTTAQGGEAAVGFQGLPHHGRGHPLPVAARRFFEPRFKASFSQVCIHTGVEAEQMNRSLGSRAFTLGNHIYFASHEFSPHSWEGRHLLAHELTHVLQQRRGLKCLQRKIIPSRVSCHAYPSAWPVFSRIGVADGPTAVAVIQRAVDQAVRLLDDTLDTLNHTRSRIQEGAPVAWPVISDTLAVALRRRFRINPDNPRVWTGRGPGSVEMALRWYGNIRRILAGDWMHYNCWGPDCDAGDVAWAYAGDYRIRLCRGFWESADPSFRALTLIHEASHIYYDTEDTGRGIGNAYCMEQFICDLKGLTVCEGCG